MGHSRLVFCVSDHTGITAEVFARSLIARFEEVDVRYAVRSFVNNAERVDEVAAEIAEAGHRGEAPLVFSTLTDPDMRARLKQSGALVLGLFDHFVDELAEELDRPPSHDIGSYHGIRDLGKYQARLDAVDFSLATDDGLGTEQYAEADIILIGVSRAGKTPTSLYMAMHHGLCAANYPLTPEDLERTSLPPTLEPHRAKLFGLTIDPVRLHQIRQRRRPDSRYAELATCTKEVTRAEQIFRQERIPVTNSTAQSIEEMAATIMNSVGLRGRLS
jgi:regulator of PEP synthase PpsR (kinase-PPPase family)